MSYRAIPLSCYCGERPDRILEVGLTSEQTMVIHYWCAACSRVLFVTKGLDECVQHCPTRDEADTPPQVVADDARFLQSMGIATPE
ncbi:MAG: hypothetical protein JWP63_4397 [Candidatus Solibacter sp.]|nr:hypothetical protein [Candidatus Solibacter sp.]